MKITPKILMIILMLIAVGVVLFILSIDNSDVTEQKNEEQNNISQEEQEFNQSGRAKAILDETDMWKIYEDKAGFSVKYPHDVNFQENQGLGHYTLTVNSQKIENLEGTMGFNKETAEKNIEFLRNGEYGITVGWPLEASKRMANLGEENAQEFMVLSRFEVCDVVFRRELYFFHNNYQISIKLDASKDEIVDAMPEYFTINRENCQDEKIWDFDKQEDFYKDIEEGSGSEIALNWFNLFNQIVKTISFYD